MSVSASRPRLCTCSRVSAVPLLATVCSTPAAWAAMTSKYPSTITAACFATIAVLARSMPKIADDL